MNVQKISGERFLLYSASNSRSAADVLKIYLNLLVMHYFEMSFLEFYKI